MTLPIHGVTILLLSAGLIAFQLGMEDGTRYPEAGWVGAGLTVLGLWSFLPFLPIGLVLFGVVLFLRGSRISGVALVTGSVLFFIAYVFGTHIGDESAADPNVVESVAFCVALLLISTGLILVGIREIQKGRSSPAGLS